VSRHYDYLGRPTSNSTIPKNQSSSTNTAISSRAHSTSRFGSCERQSIVTMFLPTAKIRMSGSPSEKQVAGADHSRRSRYSETSSSTSIEPTSGKCTKYARILSRPFNQFYGENNPLSGRHKKVDTPVSREWQMGNEHHVPAKSSFDRRAIQLRGYGAARVVRSPGSLFSERVSRVRPR
jgi:hypothetical protein